MKRKGKERGATAATGQQSWRDLATTGSRRPKIHSQQAVKRRRLKILKRLTVLVTIGLVFVLGRWGVQQWNARDTEIEIKAPSKPIERILFETNGMLPDAWLTEVVDLKPGMTMMQADIFSLKQRLETNGQVKSAMVERVFPADLRITVTERTPAMRLAVANSRAERSVRIVGDDGTVYPGIGYPKATLQRLPYVLPYQHSDGSFLPMRGIERVAELLDYARQAHPSIANDWQVISLKYYSGDLDIPGQVIEVRSINVPRILFSASSDFTVQLDRLAYIFEYVAARGNPSLKRIDLSLRGSAAVQFTSGRIGTF
jgi:cell division septal protein FtsQ